MTNQKPGAPFYAFRWRRASLLSTPEEPGCPILLALFLARGWSCSLLPLHFCCDVSLERRAIIRWGNLKRQLQRIRSRLHIRQPKPRAWLRLVAEKHQLVPQHLDAVVNHMIFVVPIIGARLLAVGINHHQVIVSIRSLVFPRRVIGDVVPHEHRTLKRLLQRELPCSLPRLTAATAHPRPKKRLPSCPPALRPLILRRHHRRTQHHT